MNEGSDARVVLLVARREFVTRVRSRVFVIGTVLSIVALAGYAAFQLLVLDRINTTPSFTVGFTADARPLAQQLQAASPTLGVIVHVRLVPGASEGEGQVRAGTLDALVTGAPSAPQVIVQSRLDPSLRSALDGLVRAEVLDGELRSAGLDPAAVQARANAASVRVHVLQPPKPNGNQQPIVGVVIALLLYLFLQIYGTQIAQGIVVEKASRVVEILLSTVRPAQILIGKVVGIGLVGLLQLLIIGAAGLVVTLPTGVLTIPAAAGGAVAGGVLWFILGFLLYGLLLAMAAAPVSRTEEAQGASLPVVMLLVVAWVLAPSLLLPYELTLQSGGTPPAGMVTAATVVSLLPPFAPVLMPIRIAAEAVPAWQLALSVALALVSIGAAAWAASRVYANSVLRFGARVPFIEAFRSR
jgi:ABC-2 type transport system permease protein